MNILLLNTTDVGGAANACIRLHEGLLKLGVNSKMLVLKKTKEHIPEIHRFLEVYESRNLVQRILRKPKVYFFFKNNRKKLNGRTTTEMYSRPETVHDITQHPLYQWADLINIHWVANFLDYPSFFKKNTKPVVWTLHDMLLFTGGYHYENGFPFKLYDPLIQENLQLKKKIFASKEFTVVSPSKWLHEEAKKAQNLYPLAKHAHIPNGIHTEIFKPCKQEEARQKLGLPLDKKIILFVAASADSSRKGIKYLLDAIKILDNKDVALAVMGKNIEQLQLDPAQTYPLGYVKDVQKIAAAYAAADLFVIPSVEDNLPNTVIESITCGTPVVGFDIGGIPDMVLSGKNGEVCSKIDAEALAQSIQKALDTDYDREWICQNAVERYAIDVQATRYKKLFESLL